MKDYLIGLIGLIIIVGLYLKYGNDKPTVVEEVPPAPVEAQIPQEKTTTPIEQSYISCGFCNAEQFHFVQEAKIRDPDAFFSSVCSKKPMCEKYAEYKYQCAEAGQINKCIEIKMNKETEFHFTSYENFCNDDGSIFGIPDKIIPSWWQCNFL
jgi:hypothetical protein